MKFSDYDGKKVDSGSPSANGKKLDAKTQKMLLSLVGKFEGRPQSEIVAEILSVAKKSKAQGKLTNDDIDAFYSMLSPLLDAEKKKTLDEVVKKIKSE